MKYLLSGIVALLFGSGLLAQPVPFLTESQYEWLASEISGDAAYEHIRFFTQFHRPGGGSPGLMEVARYVEKKAVEYGLEDVKLIKQPYSRVPWSAKRGEIRLVAPAVKLLASMHQVRLHLADYSRTTHLEKVEIVDVGSGAEDEDYQGKEVAGKIVLAYGPASEVMEKAVWKRDAAGLLLYPDPLVPDYPSNAVSRPDQIHWGRIPMESRDGKPGTFGFQLSPRQAVELKNLLETDAVLANVDIEAEFGNEKEAWQVMVEGFIRGREIGDQDVVLTGHLQEEMFSANDDASGCASVLEIARSVNVLIQSGRLERPRRNLRFWWVTEISSQRQFFADHPEAHKAMFVNINQDMVGADQSQDVMRVQNMTRVPFSRFHFLNDVAESILEFVKEGNTANLSILQAGNMDLYPRPILSRLGSRHRYNAEAIPFHNNTDHMPFNEAPIGVPGITFTNWPDNYIHSSDDDLWNVDRTQLQRNAFTVAMIAYVMADAGGDSLSKIAAEVAGRGAARMGEDLRLALTWIGEERENYWIAVHQLEEAAKRERRAIQSLRSGELGEKVEPVVKGLLEQVDRTEQVMKESCSTLFRDLYGSLPSGEERPEAVEVLASWTPRIVAGPIEFLEKRQEIESVPRLHALMAFEVINFIDGKLKGDEIFRAVAAEARRGGSHYYGTVTAQAVKSYLENARKAGVVEF